ncbi:hypothetical protein QV12_25315 [Pseudomonas putida]|nr:hypothetical protein QV12_25315 [Pseudomonas putida]
MIAQSGWGVQQFVSMKRSQLASVQRTEEFHLRELICIWGKGRIILVRCGPLLNCSRLRLQLMDIKTWLLLRFGVMLENVT